MNVVDVYKRQVTVMGYAKARIKADCAEPKSIDELREAGLQRIRARLLYTSTCQNL